MAQITSEVLNYFKLDLLIARSGILLRRIFKSRYSLFNAFQLWDDTPTCGTNYVINIISKNKRINLTPVQKTSVSNGNSEEWDVTTLTNLLLFIDRPKTLSKDEIQQIDIEDKYLQQLRDIRNKLAHNAKKSLDDVQFNQLWSNLTKILIAFGDVDIELCKLKDDDVFKSAKQPINEENTKIAISLNSSGTQAFKERNYSEAIAFFTRAIVLPGVSEHDRATFYSNMAESRLSLHAQNGISPTFELEDTKDQRYCALKDAKQSRNLWPTWWKAHFRVGKVYATLNDHKRAINSFQRALALDPTKTEIKTALDESHVLLIRQEHPDDVKLHTKTLAEVLKEQQQKFGTDPEAVRKYHQLLEEIDPVRADVFKGHQYAQGDIDIKQDYEQAAKYFAKAASQGNAEAMYNLALLTDRGFGVKKDHNLALELFRRAAVQPPEHSTYKGWPNVGVAESEHALGVRYFEGIAVDKDLGVAAYWFQRAVDHGSAPAANNLGSMYWEGLAFQKDLTKAEELFELAARRGDSLAMYKLSELQLEKCNFPMAKVWHERACEAGSLDAQNNHEQFTRKLERLQYSHSDDFEVLNRMSNYVKAMQKINSPSVVSHRSYLNDYNLLSEYAKQGSVTAQTMCTALQHFRTALNLLICFETLTEDQENMFIHELSQCYRIESITAQIPCQMHERISNVINRVLRRYTEHSESIVSQLDEDVRVCYATFHLNSYEQVRHFLDRCKKKYPKSTIFLMLSGSVNGFLHRSEEGLHDINQALLLEPENYDLLYHRAVHLRHLGVDYNEAIKAYRTFLKHAPKDHRNVPDVYYEMAICHNDIESLGEIRSIYKLYKEGKQAEKSQLPCFLPYHSANLPFIMPIVDIFENIQNVDENQINNRTKHLKDSHRVEVITKHRQWESVSIQEGQNEQLTTVSTTVQSRITQKTSPSLIGLKPITIRELDPRKDHLYKGYVLSVTIIEESYSPVPSIHLVVEDANFDCERMLIYSFPKDQAQYLISQVYTIGSKMHIINPYLRIGAIDGKPSIRVDDFSSIVMQNKSEWIPKMCRYCCEPNASHVCSKCQEARYCSKECQTMDWKLYKHQLICKKK